MKRNVKIIIASLFAVVGISASIGGAYALYKSAANPSEFTIGTYTHSSSGKITYKVGEVVNDFVGGDKISPDNKSGFIKVPLGGVYSDGIAEQEYVYGNLKVDATISSELVNKVKWSVYIQGYKTGSYWGNWDKVGENLPLRKFTDGDTTLTATTTNLAKDVAVQAVAEPTIPEEVEGTWANQWLEIYIDFTDALTSEEDMIALAGKSFKIDVTFGAPSEGVDIPLIYGDQSGWAEDALEYRMVPNIDADKWQWKYVGLENCSKMIIYYKQGEVEHYIKAKEGGDENGNLVLDNTATYQVYYAGKTVVENQLLVNPETHIVYNSNEYDN